MKRSAIIISILSFSITLSLYAQQPELVLPVAHTKYVSIARFSHDNKYVLTGGEDQTVNIWETFSGKKIRSLGGTNGSISNAFFSNDSKFIALSTDSTIFIWSVPSYVLLGKYNLVKSARFSPDSKKLFLLGYNGTVRQISLPSMRKEYEYRDSIHYKRDHSGIINRMAVSNDGKLFCSAGDSSIIIRDINTGRIIFRNKITGTPQTCFFTTDGTSLIIVTDEEIKRVELKNKLIVTRFGNGPIDAAFLSRNKRFLLVSHYELEGKAVLWDFEKYISVFNSDTILSVNDYFAEPGENGEYVYKTGTAAFGFPRLLSSRSVVVSNDGKYIRISEVMWNCADNAKSYLIEDNYLRKSDISNDGKFLLIRQKDEIISLWDVAEKKIIQSYQSLAEKIRIAEISPDGRKLLLAGDGNTVKICDAHTARINHVLPHGNRISYAAFNNDGTKVLTNSFDSTAKLWDAVTGGLLQTFGGHHPEISPACFLPNGEIAFAPVKTAIIEIYNDEFTEVIRDSSVISPYDPESIWFLAAIKSPSGLYSLYDFEDGTFGIYDSLNKKTGLSFSGSVRAFSHNDKYLAISENVYSDTLRIWDIGEGRWIYAAKVSTNAADIYGRTGINQLLFTPDTKYLLASDFNSVIHVLAMGSFREEFTLPGQWCSISTDNKYLLTLNQGKCELYDFEKRKLLYTCISVDSVNQLVIDPQQRFDGTELARKLLYYSCGNEIVDLDQAKDQLWVPDLAERIMKGDSINARTISQLNICGLTPEVEEKRGSTDDFTFKIIPRRGGLGETVLSVNGTPAKTYRPEQLKVVNGGFELIVKKEELSHYFIAGQQNPVTVKSYTSDNTISSRGFSINVDKTKVIATPPNLYAVMVGISDYKGEELDLKYAAKDATDISGAISGAAKKLLNNDGREHVFMYNLTTSKDRYRLPEKISIRNTLQEIGSKATANDILLIFFAGHGVMEGEKKQFYFLTADASKISATDAIADVGISTAELTEWMKPQNIRAQKRILIFDACNSGQAIKDFVKMGNEDQNYLAARDDEKARQIKAIDKLNEKSGLFILSASATNQSAYEMGRYSQGLLTYALLKAIKEQPDILDDNKYLNVSRWFNAAEKTVSELSKESGARQEPQIVSNTNFNIGIVDADVMAAIILPGEKALFTACNFQNSDAAIADDDLELSKLINLQLNDMAARSPDSKIVYVTATNSPDAYSLSGRYTVKENSVTITVNIKQNKVVKSKFELSGSKDRLNELAAGVAEKAAGVIK